MEFSEAVPREVRFANAEYALDQIRKGNAIGSVRRLQFRSAIERLFGSLGALLGSVPLLSIALVVIITTGLSLGLLVVEFEVEPAELWVEQGGRLENELDYTNEVLGKGAESSNEFVIQVAKNGKSAITEKTLLEHLQVALRVVHNVSVSHLGHKWDFSDVCFRGPPPRTIVYPALDSLIEALNPCGIPTVLDCFWEGGLLRDIPKAHRFVLEYKNGSIFYETYVNWSNLSLATIVDRMAAGPNPVDPSLGQLLVKAVFVFIDKPCLVHSDLSCPHHGLTPTNITAALLEQCKSYAAVWHSDLIVSGDAWRHGGPSPAVETIFGLASQQDMKKRLESRLNREYSLEDARELLRKWRREFSKVVYDTESEITETDASVWTTDSGRDVVDRFADGNVVLLAVGYILMVTYAGLAFVDIKSIVRSRVNVGLVGVIFVCLALTSGLGLSAMFGLKFNPTTTRVLPFLVLGLGVDDMFVLAHSFFHVFDDPKCKSLPMSEITRKCLERVGHSITLTSVTNSAGFLLAAVIPIPAMRVFALQVGICVILDYLVLLFAFPAYLSMDGSRIRRQLCDVLCCCGAAHAPECLRRGDSADDQKTTDKKPPRTESRVGLTAMNQRGQDDGLRPGDAASWGDRFVCNVYSPLIRHTVTKIVVICITLVLLGLSGYYITEVKDGLDFTEVVPSGTPEHDFVVANKKYFSFGAVTIVYDYNNDFSSPKWQKAALEFHRKFAQVEWITKDVDASGKVFGVSEPFWLDKMIEFFGFLQYRYDLEIAKDGRPSAFMAAVQGLLNLSNYSTYWHILDTYEGTKVIPGDHFYRYLTAWTGLDLVSPAATLPSFRPEPPYWHMTLGTPVPAAKPLRYAAMPMYATGLTTSREEISLLKDVRHIIEEAKADGISAYPRGQTFTYYEQYIHLRRHLYLAIGLILIACFLATTALLLSIWSGIIMVGMLLVTAFEVYGFLGLADIQFSAVPCVSVIVSVGATVEFTAPLCLMFVKTVGTRDQRVHYSLMYRFIPIFNGAVSTLLGFIMLSFAEFEFIIKYFLFIFLALLVLGTFNGLALLPVILSWIGPPPQVIPTGESAGLNDIAGKPIEKGKNGVEVPTGEKDNGIEIVAEDNV